ncbi:MAG: glycosyltransferase family 2 protein [Myxococcota bacterium]|nr:glycosyltransferase family 2 protein [Myxococcota bacterium]
MPMTLGLSIPFYNEAAVIPQSLTALADALSALPHKSVVVLVNNGSTDATGERLAEWCERYPTRFTLCDLPHNQGYGGGILAGLRILEAKEVDWIGWMWGDNQIDPQILTPLCGALVDGADLAKANRIDRQDGWQRLAVTRAYHHLMKWKGYSMADINGCPKIMTRALYEHIQPTAHNWFLDPEVMIAAQTLGAAVHNEETVMRPRLGGESKIKATTLIEFLWYVRGL